MAEEIGISTTAIDKNIRAMRTRGILESAVTELGIGKL